MTGTIEQAIIAGVFGASFGSFLNVVAHRSVQGRSWLGLNDRSICESCGHVLEAADMIPILSWLIQRGKCRHCGAKISARYVIVEVLCALMAVMMALRWGMSWAFAISCVSSCGLVVNSLTDYESGDVFDVFALVPGVVCLLMRIAGGWLAVLDGLEGALFGWGIFAAIILLSRGGMGWGDAVFMAGAGCALGLRFTVFAFYAGIMAGGMWVIALLVIGRLHWGKGEAVPLVPFLAAGCFMTLIYGAEIFAWLQGRMLYPSIFSVTWPFTL